MSTAASYESLQLNDVDVSAEDRELAFLRAVIDTACKKQARETASTPSPQAASAFHAERTKPKPEGASACCTSAV